jgi:hypothetical protein
MRPTRKTGLLVLATVFIAWVSTGVAGAEGRRFYLGAGIGSGSFKAPLFANGSPDSFDESDASWKLYGGFRLNRYFSVEVAWEDFGSPTETLDAFDVEVSVDTYGPVVSGVGTLPLGRRFELLGTAGVLVNQSDIVTRDLSRGTETRVEDPSSHLQLGLGARLSLGDRWRARGQAEWYNLADGLWLYTVGLEWSF